MKLAEALILRKDLQARVARLRDRLFSKVVYQEGDAPSEDPKALMAKLNDTFTELEHLVSRINKTNALTELDGQTLAEAVTSRDIQIRKLGILREALNKAADRRTRYSNREIRLLTTLDVLTEEQKLDRLAYEARVLDSRIQAKNWEVELL